MNKFLRIFLSVLILVWFGVWVVRHVTEHATEFHIIREVPLAYYPVLYFVSLCSMLANGIYLKHVLLAFNASIPFKEWFPLSVFSTGLNYLLPLRGGAVARAGYLKVKYSFRFRDFVSVFSAISVMYILANGIMGLMAIGLLWLNGHAAHSSISLFLLAATVLPVSFLSMRGGAFRRIGVRVPLAGRVLEGWIVIVENRPVLVRIVLTAFVQAFLFYLTFLLAFLALGIHLPPGGVLFYSAAQGLAALVTITPGALGIMESLAVFMGSSLGYTESQALLVQGLFRAVSLAAIFSFFPFTLSFLAFMPSRNSASGVDTTKHMPGVSGGTGGCHEP